MQNEKGDFVIVFVTRCLCRRVGLISLLLCSSAAPRCSEYLLSSRGPRVVCSCVHHRAARAGACLYAYAAADADAAALPAHALGVSGLSSQRLPPPRLRTH
eukprot:scaffold3854_cov107-Isochrysis_galbana.AAC.11